MFWFTQFTLCIVHFNCILIVLYLFGMQKNHDHSYITLSWTQPAFWPMNVLSRNIHNIIFTLFSWWTWRKTLLSSDVLLEIASGHNGHNCAAKGILMPPTEMIRNTNSGKCWSKTSQVKEVYYQMCSKVLRPDKLIIVPLKHTVGIMNSSDN